MKYIILYNHVRSKITLNKVVSIIMIILQSEIHCALNHIFQ